MTTPRRRALAEATLVVVSLSAVLTFVFGVLHIGRPSPEILEALAQIGATLLIAYVVEVSWLVKAGKSRPLKEREDRLGAFLGVGAAGLLSVATSLVLAQRAAGPHWGLPDELAFGFVVGSLSMAGLVIVLQPLITHEWLDDDAQPATGTEDRGP